MTIEAGIPTVEPVQSRSERQTGPAGTPSPISDEACAAIAETFRALADPTRLKITYALAERPQCVSELAQLARVSEPAVSQHLRLLRALRIVRGRRAGKQVYYHLADDHVRELLAIGLGHHAEQPATGEER